MANQQLGTNTFTTAKWIVSATASDGTHTTIASALTSASSGDTIFIRPGTFTENLTLKAGVNLAAYACDAQTPNVTIVGKLTATFTGTCSISGIRLQTNSDNILSTSGSNVTNINLVNCHFALSNNTGFSLASSGGGIVQCLYCTGDTTTTGIAYFAMTNTNTAFLRYCILKNTGVSTTSSTVANSCELTLRNCLFTGPITTSNSGAFTSELSEVSSGVTALTINGTGNSLVDHSIIGGPGAVAAITIGSGAVLPTLQSTITGFTANVITGVGTIQYAGLSFNGSGNAITTTTQTAFISRPGITRSDKQPAFLAYLATNANNATGDSTTFTVGTGTALTEVFDQNSDFNTNGTFTAPYTGIYFLEGNFYVTGGTVITTSIYIINTSNRAYRIDGRGGSATTEAYNNLSVLADMDAADTATFQINLTDSGGKVDDLVGGSTLLNFFSGKLSC